MNDISTQLNDFIEANGLTGASVARSIGLSTGTVSLVRTGKINQVSDENIKKFEHFIKNYSLKTGSGVTTGTTHTTRDLTLAHFSVDEVIIAECMGCILGKAGTGKTTAMKAYVESHPEAIFIETTPCITQKDLLCEILAGLGIQDTAGNNKKLMKTIVAHFKKSERVLIIDEAENLTTQGLEVIRRIHDFSRVPTVLVGTYALLNNLKGRGGDLLQLYSRINEKYEMNGFGDDDREALFGEMGQHIKKFTSDIRRSCAIYRKAVRLSQLSNQVLSSMHIKMATQSVILD